MQNSNDYAARIARLQGAMKELGLAAVLLEPGTAMLHFTGVRWGRSERTFAVVLPAKGGPVWIVPAFEEMRAKELIRAGDEVRIWQEDESPFQRIADALKDRGAASGPVGIEDSVRFFVFDGVRKVAPGLEYVSAQPVLW